MLFILRDAAQLARHVCSNFLQAVVASASNVPAMQRQPSGLAFAFYRVWLRILQFPDGGMNRRMGHTV
jgi:hypothetical protein